MSNTYKPKLLGVAASLRNARWGIGNRELVDKLKYIDTQEGLFTYLKEESELHFKNFLEAGRQEGKPFLEIYKNLRKLSGKKGLSNTEVSLAAALWAAHKKGVDIDHISLAEYFPHTNETYNIEELKQKLISSDGIIISGPVYFGDRGSLAHELIRLIQIDTDLRNKLTDKIYAGISVGAKRNGGQETTLIYQMRDMLDLGFLALGNDSETTAQYGGTGHAGDIGTMYKDDYGLNTSMGTGRRVAEVIRKISRRRQIKPPTRILFMILQDAEGLARKTIESICMHFKDKISYDIEDFTTKDIKRCIACDFCPTHIDEDTVYRCVIHSDDFMETHRKLLFHDAIIPVVVALKDHSKIVSRYQTVIERTRYLRRGDYVFSNLLVSPFTIEEIGLKDFHDIRMMTSMIRHHTIMSKPITGYVKDMNIINQDELISDFRRFINNSFLLAAARLSEVEVHKISYKPVGYILSTNKDVEDERLKKRNKLVDSRQKYLVKESHDRLITI